MAGLKFDVVVRLERLVKLKEEIDKTRKEIDKFQQEGDSKNVNKLTKSLEKLEKQYTKLSDEITNMADKLRSSGEDFEVAENDINRVTSSLLKLGGAAFSLNFAKDFISQITKVRGEFQQLEIAFGAMLKSEERATVLMDQLADFSARTPFGLDSAASGAKQLIAYGSVAENVIDELTMLGDVAGGTEQSINDLVYLYGTLRTQGRAYLMDIRQFAGRGIPIYDELAKVLGIAKNQVNDFVSSGKVGFKEVEQAFRNMTSEGGLYGGLMERQSASINGQMEQLSDSVKIMFNTIGKESESIIYRAIGAASDLIANYEKVGKVLAGLIATYGTYRAAIMLNIALEKGWTISQLSHYKALLLVEKAQKLLNSTMLKNPYVLIATTVVGLASAMWALHESTTKAEQVSAKFQTAVQSERSELNRLFSELNKTKEGTNDRRLAIENINLKYGQYLSNLLSEKSSLEDVKRAQEDATRALVNDISVRMKNEHLEKYMSNQTKAYESLYKNITKISKNLTNEQKGQFQAYVENAVKSSRDGFNILRKGLNEITGTPFSELDKMFSSWDANDFDHAIKFVYRTNNDLKNAQEETIEIFDSYVESLYPKSENEENLIEKQFVDIQKEVENTIDKISTLKQEIADLRSGKTQVEVGVSLSDTIDEKVKELNDAEKKLSTLTGIDKKEVKKNQSKTAKRQLNDQERINEEMRKMTERNISDRIALMDEGTQKELTQIKDKYNKAIAEIKKRESEWKKAQGGSLTFEQDVIIHTATINADSERAKSEHAIIKSLVEKYKDYADQRLDIEKKFNKDIEVLQEERSKAEASGNTEMTYQLNRAIAKATKDKGTELISFDFDLLKKSPEYIRAFEDLKNTSTETLNSLLSQLEAMKGNAAEVLDPADLQTYTSIIQQIIDELAERNPFQTLANAQNSLVKANQNLAKARNNLDKAIDSGNTEEIARATIKYNEALDESTKTSRDVEKAQKKVTDAIGGLYDALSGVGNAIGGTAGEIINFIADIGKFVLTTSEGMKTTAEGASRAIAMIEKASAILFIIQMAIQLISQLQSFIKDAHQQYLDYSKEIAQINALRDAVTEYQISVLKAKQAQDSWFGNDNLKNLKHEWELNGKYAEAYSKKLNEDQAKYQNEMGGGWLTNTVQWLGDAYGKTLGKVYDITVGKVSETLMGDIGKTIADVGEAASFGLGTQAELEKYNKETVKALENLRIETRAAKKGFLGSGIGGKSQRTEDLRTWARENGFGELFDENNIIDTSVAEAILKANEEGTIKLVGETEKTLEALKEYQELYEEYQNKLQEYVSNLYEPLVDNFVDAMWDWFDNGKNALDSFKEYASDTFRDIVSDMIRTIVINDVFGSFADDVKNLYTEYFQGKMTEDQLMEEVSKLTNKVMDNAEKQLPGLENVINTISDSFKNAGIDIMQPGEASENTLKGAFAKASQESIDLLAGQTGAVRVALEDIRRMMLEDESGLRDEYYASFQNSLNIIRDIQVSGLNEMVAIREISGRVEGLTGEIRDLNNRIADSNEQISVNTKRSADNSDAVVSAGIKLKAGGLGA